MKVLLLLAKGVEMLEASAFIDVLGWHRDYCKGDIQVVTCGVEKKVLSTFNIPIEVDELLSQIDINDYEALAIPGGFGSYGFYEEAHSEAVSDLIRAFDNAGKWIASICVGALALGYSGVLENRRATTYHLMDGRRQSQLAEYKAIVVNEPVVIDENIITSWCPSTAVEVALQLLERLSDKAEADTIRTLMGY